MPEMWDDDMLQKLHHVLLEVSAAGAAGAGGPKVLRAQGIGCLLSRAMHEYSYRSERLANVQLHVEEGKMTCRNCGHIYPIQNGIPNMVSCVRLLETDSQLLAEHEISR